MNPETYHTYNQDPYVPGTEYGRERGHAPSSSEPYRTGMDYNRGRDDVRSITPRALNVIKRTASDNIHTYDHSVAPTTGYAPESIIEDYAEGHTVPESSYDGARRYSDQGRAYASLEGRERQVHSPPPILRQMFAPRSEDGSSVYTSDTHGIQYADDKVIDDDMRRRRRERLEMEEKREEEAKWKRLREHE
jgi:hypothetical protein